jgi:penicillin-binding protein-related factor A (putative recombinase)
VDNLNSQHQTIYPNPAKDVFFVESKDIIKSIEVHDVSGKSIMKKNTENKSKVEVNISNFQPGIYIVKVIERSDCEINKKFIITK